jgi:ABC-type polysaccharide/polyol phosphate export permease
VVAEVTQAVPEQELGPLEESEPDHGVAEQRRNRGAPGERIEPRSLAERPAAEHDVDERARLLLDAVRERRQLEDPRVGQLARDAAHVLEWERRRFGGAVSHPQREGQRMEQPATVDHGASFRQELDALLPQSAQRERRLAASGRQHDDDSTALSRQPEPVQPGHAAPVEVRADSREGEVEARAPGDTRVVAGHMGVVPLEDGDRSAEVVDDGPVADLVDDVSLRDECRRRVAEGPIVRFPELETDRDVGVGGSRSDLEPGEIATDRLDHLLPASAEPKPQAVHVELVTDHRSETVRAGAEAHSTDPYHRVIARPSTDFHAAAAADSPLARRKRDARPYDVLFALTAADLRTRYGRGPLRVVKWLLDPFALVGVYLILVTFVLNRPGFAPGLSLACAVVPFQLIMTTVINAMSAITTRRSIILNMAFPRTLLPVSSALTEAVGFLASFSLFAVMMASYRVAPTYQILWLPVIVAVTICFAIAISFPALLFGLWFRELRPVAISLVRTMFFLGSGLVPLSATQGSVDNALKLNPFTAIFESYREVLMFDAAPRLWEILYPLGLSAGLIALFLPLYLVEQRQFAKVVE